MGDHLIDPDIHMKRARGPSQTALVKASPRIEEAFEQLLTALVAIHTGQRGTALRAVRKAHVLIGAAAFELWPKRREGSDGRGA